MGQQGEGTDTDFRRQSSPASKSSVFYRMIVSSIIQDKKLRIPGKFVKKLGNELPAVVTLTTPNGCVWNVGLKKIDDNVCFTDGWEEFVKHQSIRAGYLLIFTYVGDSNFSVNIYDLASAEIKYQCNTLSSSEGPNCGNRCPVPYNEAVEDDDSVEILDSRRLCQTTPKSLENKCFYEPVKLQKLGKSYVPPLSQNLVKPSFEFDLGSDKHDKSKSSLQGLKFEDSCSIGSKNLKLEHHKGMREANSVKYWCFSDEAKGDKRHDAKNLEKALVPYVQYMGCNFTGTDLKNSYYKASAGNLHGDIVKSTARSTRDIGVQCCYSELMTSAYEIRLHSLIERPEITSKRKLDECELSAKHGGEVQIYGTETSYGTFLRRWRMITPEEKEKVLNASKMFQSENPFCRVILRRSYVYKGIGLHLPSSFAGKYLVGVSGFITLQVSNGEKWSVRCAWRDRSAKLSKGWPKFVWDNRLDEGDVCVFELMKTEEIVLKVTIFPVVEDAEPVKQLPKEHLGRTSQLATGYDLNG